MPHQDKITIQSSTADFKIAHEAKKKLIDREYEDFLFALGDQWTAKEKRDMETAGMTPVTDNRIGPNIFLLTGLQRQNRTDFKAFPEGDEDGLVSDIASRLLKNSIKRSGLSFKTSEQFKDGITAGECHLEPFLDNTESLINAKPCWNKCDGDVLFPHPGSREYDYSDAKYVYKLTKDIEKGDLINIFPDKKSIIKKSTGGKVGMILDAQDDVQHKDYPNESDTGEEFRSKGTFDLLERYYKKWVENTFIGDRKTGNIEQAESVKSANEFIDEYRERIAGDESAFEDAVGQALQVQGGAGTIEEQTAQLEASGSMPPKPPFQDPDRYFLIKRMVPEIWLFAHSPGISEPLADERAWFYPKWKKYPFVTYFARFSTAPLRGKDSHLKIQGLVHGVKEMQRKHNKAEMLMMRHLNTSANSGWIAEEGAWTDPQKVKMLGTTAGVNLEYKKNFQRPERITPVPLSQGHAQMSESSVVAMKEMQGINASLLASEQNREESGRAIALKQRQGLLMVQEIYDNLSRSLKYAGEFLLSQMGEMYDTESAKKVLGEAFLAKNFPPVPQFDTEGNQIPSQNPDGTEQIFDEGMADIEIARVLSGEIGEFDVSVGETAASDSQKLADSAEVMELAEKLPGLITPDILVNATQLPEATKAQILSSIQQAQAAAQAAEGGGEAQ